MVATDAVWARRLEQIRVLRSMVRRMPRPWDVDRLWSEMQERRAATTLAAATSPSADTSRLTQHSRRATSARVTGAIAPVRRGRWTTLARIAAVVAITAGALWYTTRAGHDRRVAHYQIEAERGRVTSARLADGSRVTLAAGSVLDVPREFGRERDVTLIGQAYFEIAHDSTRPFRVHTRGALTRVLGTRFDVRAYPEDSNVTVLVTEGRVEFGPDDGERARSGAAAASGTGPAVLLTRGDRARLEPDGKLRVEHGVAVDRELAWLRGRLVFVDAPLSAVALEVERWYGVHIVVDDTSLASAPVTATFGNEPVDGILRTLAISLDARLKRSGDTAWLGTPR
jgi:ferric-dicitrate binding protein FerR (iron transport regulator)